jgi:hypothetical protein
MTDNHVIVRQVAVADHVVAHLPAKIQQQLREAELIHRTNHMGTLNIQQRHSPASVQSPTQTSV